MITTRTVGVFYGFMFTLKDAQQVKEALNEIFEVKDERLIPRDPVYHEFNVFTSLLVRELTPDTLAVYPETLTYETETFTQIVFPLPDVKYPQKGWGEAEMLGLVMKWDVLPTWHVYLL